jgi:enoyl-CoA hydratase/carnithine racemase
VSIQPVEVSTAGDVVTIRLNRPDKRNAITAAMYTTLADALTAAEASGAAVVVLTGTGGAFTAGNDLHDMRENPPVGDNPPPVRFLAALTGLRAVLVAAVDGPAVGVGTTVLLHCDLVYVTARSTFRLPFVDLGLVPEAASTLLLPRLVGHQRAADLMLFGERFDAATAADLGIVTAVVADADALDQLVAERTAALAAKPRAALRATKALLNDAATTTVPERLDLDRQVLQSLLPPVTQDSRTAWPGSRRRGATAPAPAARVRRRESPPSR